MNIPIDGVKNILCKLVIIKYFTWVKKGVHARPINSTLTKKCQAISDKFCKDIQYQTPMIAVAFCNTSTTVYNNMQFEHVDEMVQPCEKCPVC
jgi:hypothetical protein